MKIRLVSTSDVHGYLAGTNYSSRENVAPYGLSRAATIIKQLRAKAAPDEWILPIENGDFIQGSPLTYYIAKLHPELAPIYSRLASEIGVVAGIFGNHEFNYGLPYLDLCESARTYPMLAANIEDALKRPLFAKPYTIVEKDGVKVVILGLTTRFVPKWEPVGHLMGLTFHSALKTAAYWVPKLHQLADVVVVAYHGGMEKDLLTDEPTEKQNGENIGSRMVAEVPGIDALITGHQHRELAGIVCNVPLTQPGVRGANVGEITLELNDQHQVIHHAAQLLSTKDVAPDPVVTKLLAPLNQQVETWLDTTLGTIKGDMQVSDHFAARLHNHPYINFINQVQMAATDTDISATALFNNDVPGLKSTVTMREVVNSYVYPNTLAVLQITGADLKGALERCASYFIMRDGQVTVNPRFTHPKIRHYVYDIYQGIDYEFDLKRPMGQRVIKLNYHGQPVLPGQQLKVTLNHYRAGGGGSYPMFSAKKSIRRVTTDMAEIIADYFQQHPVVTAEQPTNFQVRY